MNDEDAKDTLSSAVSNEYTRAPGGFYHQIPGLISKWINPGGHASMPFPACPTRHPMLRHFILGTAGHIDHGKSTLVKVLTGTDPDRLPEERQRGMTIELGFAHFEITDPAEDAQRYSLGVVDVPGHADFVRNMVAGVAALDVALFIVAADDGWMPQSEEHLQILTYLGVQRAVVALTKADLAEDVDFSVEMLREEVRGSFLEGAPVVPVAAPLGRGLDELKAALATVLREAPPPLDIGKPRLPVDRAFSPTGVGTVVTGTLIGGALAGGTDAIVQPVGLPTHLRSVQSHGCAKDHARPGMRTALNLADVPLATRDKKRGVARGDVVTVARLGPPGLAVDVQVGKSARTVPGQPGFTRPLRTGQRVHLHHGAASHEARVHLLGTRSIGPGEQALAEVRCESPVHALAGDRFVLRDWSKRFTIGGGVILEAAAAPGRFRKPAQRAFLEARAAAPADVEVALRSLLTRDRAVAREGLLAQSNFSDADVRKAAEGLVKAGHALSDAGWLLEAAWWKEVCAEAAAAVEAHHAEHPETAGLPVSALRSALRRRLVQPRLFDVLVNHLGRHGFAKEGEAIKKAAYQAALPPALADAGRRLLAALAANPLDPPNPRELAPTPADQKALKFLIQSGEVVALDEKAVLAKAAYEALRTAVLASVTARGQATASEIREDTKTTRRFLIPLLEKLDRENVTRRQGDHRSVR
jgi:selenocysteine-specific elongation factor